MEENNIQKEKQPNKNVFGYINYSLTFFGALVSNLGSLLYSFAVSFYILKLTNNNAFIQGSYLAVGGIVYVLVTLFGGVIGDRFHKGKIMFVCDYLKGGVIIGMTLIMMLVCKTNFSKVVILFIIAILGNAIGAIFSPASASLLPRIIPEESLQQGQSYYSVMQSANGIVGIVLAGILYSVLPTNVLFLIVGGCYIISAFTEMFIRYDYQRNEEQLTIKTVFSDIGIGFKYLVSFKPLFYLIIATLFINFFFAPISGNFIPYFIASDVSSSEYLLKNIMEPEMWNSIVSVALSIGMIIMAIIFSMRTTKPSIIKGLRFSFVLLDVALVLLAIIYFIFFKGIIHINVMILSLVFGAFCIGLLLPTINIPSSTKMLTIVDEDKLGKVSSVMDVVSQGLIPLASFLAGTAINSLGAQWLLIICSGGLILVTAFIFINKQIAKL